MISNYKYARKNVKNFKNQRFRPSGCKDIGIIQFEFERNVQFIHFKFRMFIKYKTCCKFLFCVDSIFHWINM